MNALKHSGLRYCLQSPDLKTSVYFFYSPSNKRNPVLIINLKVPIISSKPICEALAKHLVLLHLYSPSPLLLAFFLNKRDYDSAWGLLQKAFSRRRKKAWHWLHCYNQGPWPKNLSLLTQNKWCLPFPTLSSSILPQKRSKSSPFESYSHYNVTFDFVPN